MQALPGDSDLDDARPANAGATVGGLQLGDAAAGADHRADFGIAVGFGRAFQQIAPFTDFARRAGAEETRVEDSVRVLGDLVLTGETREVHRAGDRIRLTAKEFDLLNLLMDHPRQVLSKAQILDHVWHSSFDTGGNLVEVYISSLRRKIDRGRGPMIHTVRGMGYAIRPVEDAR